ncbi:MsnO8 family LLM class oxidoreductase [Paenibacillus thalictri]|uniref:MsnO8 family LLM class oxidoreductase n=1 Tax=Paenibacillus thalictri TaxID=2527873 RepID=A0A4Q9DQH0_9BACL|nr:MsnO8 family LLM class oxidoreductase [Paenibacillus thalictri]TBL77833.1 MsnO8 family LLM class oxidoreductase [Paenibacillus thalictri]
MKLSVLDLVPILQGADPSEAIRQAVRLAQTAERLGYLRYWTSEHHDMEHLASASPEVLLAHVGAQTSRIRLGSGAVLLPHYKPLKVAEVFRLLATMYPGRVDLGVGRAPGGSAHATIAIGGNFLEQVRHFPDTLQALSELLTDDYRLDDQPVKARPLPPEPPELWLLGTNVKSAQYAAQIGAGYAFGQFMSDQDGEHVISLYRDQFQPSKLGNQPKVIVAVGVVCADTEAKARELAAAGGALFGPPAEHGAAASGGRSSRLIAGDPLQVKAELGRLGQKLGIDECMVVTMTPDYDSRIRSYELLAESSN